MSFSLDFPVLRSWQGTVRNWSEKLRKLGNAAEIAPQILPIATTWMPEVLASSAGTISLVNGTKVIGWFVRPPGTDLCYVSGNLNFSVTVNSQTAFISLPVQPDPTNGDQPELRSGGSMAQSLSCRCNDLTAVALLNTVAVTAVAPSGNRGCMVIQVTGGGTFTAGNTISAQFAGLYRTKIQS